MFAYVFVTVVIASILFSIRGLLTHSWLMWWFSALFSFIVSVVSGFSIGGVLFLFTCLQIAMVLVIGEVMPHRFALPVVLLGAGTWFVLIPFQIYGIAWLGGFGIYAMVGLLALIAVPFLCVRHQRFVAIAS